MSWVRRELPQQRPEKPIPLAAHLLPLQQGIGRSAARPGSRAPLLSISMACAVQLMLGMSSTPGSISGCSLPALPAAGSSLSVSRRRRSAGLDGRVLKARMMALVIAHFLMQASSSSVKSSPMELYISLLMTGSSGKMAEGWSRCLLRG